MELKAFEKQIRYIAIDQLTQTGWVDIIRIPIDNSDTLTPDQIQEGVEEVIKRIYDNDKMHISTQGKGVTIDCSKTHRVYASPNKRLHDTRLCMRIVSN